MYFLQEYVGFRGGLKKMYVDKLKLKLKPAPCSHHNFFYLLGSGQIWDEHVCGDIFCIVLNLESILICYNNMSDPEILNF